MYTTIEEFEQSVMPKLRKFDCTDDLKEGDVVTTESGDFLVMYILNYNDVFAIEYGVLH